MGLFTSREDQLIEAVVNGNPQLRLEHCLVSLEQLLRNAVKKEPRILAFLAGYETSYISNGLSRSYDVILHYREDAPRELADVTLDEGDWDAGSLMTPAGPREAVLVTEDPKGVQTKLSEALVHMIPVCEGLHGWNSDGSTFAKISSKSVLRFRFSYMLPLAQLRQIQGKATFAARNIWRCILGRASVPQFVKPFLALSYIAQECVYDQRAYDELEAAPKEVPTDPVPHLAYGPLVEGRGICSGLAWAFKRLMDEAKIECICVSGWLKEDTKLRHMWTMVKIADQYYHVDPTWDSKRAGVCVSALMQPDAIMKTTHIWDETQYPKARGTRFDYDYVEEYLADHGSDFLDAGANEKYFFPETIVE